MYKKRDLWLENTRNTVIQMGLSWDAASDKKGRQPNWTAVSNRQKLSYEHKLFLFKNIPAESAWDIPIILIGIIIRFYYRPAKYLVKI